MPVQQIQGGMHSSRIAVIPCLLCKQQLVSQLLVAQSGLNDVAEG